MDICVRIGLNSKSDRSEYTSPLGEKRVMLSSNREENRNIMKRLESLGVSYAVIAPNADGRVWVADQLSGMKMISEDFVSNPPTLYVPISNCYGRASVTS